MAGYGFKPVRDDLAVSPANWYRLADGSTGNIFFGDLVDLLATGLIQRQNTTTGESPVAANPTLGVVVGCKYVDGDGRFINSHWYKGGSLNTQIRIAVITDPEQVYQIQSDGPTTFADVGFNAPIVNFAASAGSTVTGNSGIQLDDSAIAQTGDLACKIVGIVNNGANEFGTSTVDVLVKLRRTCMQLEIGDPIP